MAILKMATGRNFSMSGINSGHHYLPTLLVALFKMAATISQNSTLSNIITILYVGK
jgi:hypothetical protein